MANRSNNGMRASLLATGGFLLCATTMGQTASDACSFAAGSRYTVNTACNYQTFNKPGSYVPNVTATGCTGSGNDDAFGWFQATATTTTISYNTSDLGTNPIIHVYTGTCASLVAAGCVNATGAAGFLSPVTETTTLATVVGQNYLVRIQNQGTNNGMNGRLCIWSPPPPPVNDNCANAIDLPVFESCFNQVFTNVGATASGTTPAPACSSAPSTDVWFSFVAPASGAVRIVTEAGTLADAALQLYSGGCGGMALVPNGCDDDSGPGTMPLEDRRCAALTGGNTYYIRVWGFNGATGTFGICVRGVDVFPTPQQDCSGGFTVCNSGGISNSSDYTGCSVDLNSTNRGCLTANERQGTWYFFSPQMTGNYGFSLQPVDNGGNPANIDYDFAIWGPMSTITCPPAAAPLRCSYALPNQGGGNYTTGMAAGNSDVSETATGAGVNGFTAPINVPAASVGRVYVMYLDNFTTSGQAFNLTWSLPSPTALDCSLLPVELLTFTARAGADRVHVKWRAQAGGTSERFIVEHSIDAVHFRSIGSLEAETSDGNDIDYWWDHNDPLDGVNYYRLRMENAVGDDLYSEVVPVQFKRGLHVLLPRPNPASGSIRVDVPEADTDFYELRSIDASGRVVRSVTVNSADGRSGTLELPLDGLDAGSYLLQVLDNTGAMLGTGRFAKE